MSLRKTSRDSLRPPSGVLLRLFSFYLNMYFPRHFHAVRIAGEELLQDEPGPKIIYLNHASWWDPLTCMLLARRFFPEKTHYAPMDAEALERYKILGKMGMFPVERGTRRGAEQFLRASSEAMGTEGAMLWLTPQGTFSDVRQRPLEFRPGLAGVLKRNPGTTAVPIAIEYVFWDERLPEVLIQVGVPQRFEAGVSTAEIESSLVSALGAAQDALASLAMARDARLFKMVLSGKSGVGLAYDLWRRMVAMVRGKKYRGEHTAVPTIADEGNGEPCDLSLVNSLKDGGTERR